MIIVIHDNQGLSVIYSVMAVLIGGVAGAILGIGLAELLNYLEERKWERDKND
mgnify:CR=1 FL=1